LAQRAVGPAKARMAFMFALFPQIEQMTLADQLQPVFVPQSRHV
jgi:hypothetical protein